MKRIAKNMTYFLIDSPSEEAIAEAKKRNIETMLPRIAELKEDTEYRIKIHHATGLYWDEDEQKDWPVLFTRLYIENDEEEDTDA